MEKQENPSPLERSRKYLGSRLLESFHHGRRAGPSAGPHPWGSEAQNLPTAKAEVKQGDAPSHHTTAPSMLAITKYRVTSLLPGQGKEGQVKTSLMGRSEAKDATQVWRKTFLQPNSYPKHKGTLDNFELSCPEGSHSNSKNPNTAQLHTPLTKSRRLSPTKSGICPFPGSDTIYWCLQF